MPRSVVNVVKKVCLLTAVAVLISGVGLALPLQAADTRVDAVVCSGTSSSATLAVESPLSDSVVDTMPLVVEGPVNHITQIEISIDGEYDRTVPIGVGQTSFSTLLQLSSGTHTIDLVGNDVCQFQNPTATVVITYQPKAVPGDGGSTPTQTPASPTAPEDSVVVAPINKQEKPFGDIPIIKDILPVIGSLATALDIDATAKDGGLAAAMARFALFSTGVGLTFFGGVVTRWVRRKVTLDWAVRRYINGGLQDPKLGEHIRRDIWIAHSLGILLIVVAFLV